MQGISIEREIGQNKLRLRTVGSPSRPMALCSLQYGETTVLTAAVEGPGRDGQDFFPLTVDYASAPTPPASSRAASRSVKAPPRPKKPHHAVDRPPDPPLFPEGYKKEVQIMTTVSVVGSPERPGILSLIGASAALYVSHMPFQGPVAAVRLGKVNGELVVFPTNDQLNESDMDLVVAGNSSRRLHDRRLRPRAAGRRDGQGD